MAEQVVRVTHLIFLRIILCALPVFSFACSDPNMENKITETKSGKTPISEATSETQMKFYQVRNRELWGDYGAVLIHGMTSGSMENDGPLELERAGPFMPPVTFPALCDPIVTDEFRKALETSGLAEFGFRPVIKAKIVDLPWEHWNLNAEDAPFYPPTGEPSDYFIELPHSDAASEAMGDVWQLKLPIGAVVDIDIKRAPWDYDVRVHVETWNGAHVFYGDKYNGWQGTWVIVSEVGKKWLEEHCGEWVRFLECPVK
ncbi:MAG: hypothetical protein WD065_09440 [Planctomycetaceae bacterium]